MTRVPRRWADFYVHRDDPLEPASALCCVVSAAVYLGSVVKDEQTALRVIEQLDLGVSFDDLNERTVRALAEAAGLNLWRPNVRSRGLDDLSWRIEDPGEETLWLAWVRMSAARSERRASPADPRYVLVLEVLGGRVIVADPLRARAPIHVVPEGEFLASWEAARGPTKPKWAGCLGRARGPSGAGRAT
jgi:hypothetical protein